MIMGQWDNRICIKVREKSEKVNKKTEESQNKAREK